MQVAGGAGLSVSKQARTWKEVFHVQSQGASLGGPKQCKQISKVSGLVLPSSLLLCR